MGMKNFGLLLIFMLCMQVMSGFAQLVAPFDFPLLLSGNFGELRSDHFHSGVDFKTGGVVGKPIRCVADGYVCRASVTPGGYGKALYVMHYNGYMTVYAHLDRFPPAIAKRVRQYQYRNETFRTDLWFGPGEFRVKQGEFLAYSGNSGYSFGPHLHFEIRDAKGNELYDPMSFYKDKLTDTRPPRAHAISVYPKRGKGSLFGGGTSRVYDIVNGGITEVIEAWGDIGFGVKALDYMDGTSNKYGVRIIELLVDGDTIFRSSMDGFSFDENLLINSWIDYGRLYYSNEWFQKMFVETNNTLRVIGNCKNNGWLTVDEERDYNVECRLTDYHDNTSSYTFVVRGKRCSAVILPKSTHVLYCNANNRVNHLGMRLYVPKGVLFEDAFLNVSLQGSDGLSWRYNLADTVYPMLDGSKISIWVGDDPPVDKSKLYIRHLAPDDTTSVGGVYRDGWIISGINTIACYDVAVDTIPPVIVPVDEDNWKNKNAIKFSFEENETSLASFMGTLDGRFVLFEYSSKNSEFTLDLNREGVKRGIHDLRLVVVDKCGNEAVYEKVFEY